MMQESVNKKSNYQNNNDLHGDWFGKRLVENSIVTKDQLEELVSEQQSLRMQGSHVRIGDLAVSKGFCSKKDIDKMPGYIGDKLVKAGFLSTSERDNILKWQSQLRTKGVHVPFGVLVIEEGICQKDDIEQVINQ